MEKKQSTRKGTRTEGTRASRAARVESAAAADIAERSMPGWKAVAPTGPVRSFGAKPAGDVHGRDAGGPFVDAVMPSTVDVHRKFSGEAGADSAEQIGGKPLSDDVEIVEMKSGDLRRSVGVNRRTKKVEWSQG